MVTFTCPRCGQTRTGKRRRCYQCTKTILTAEAREKCRLANLGLKHSQEWRGKNSEAHKGSINRFDLGAFTRGKRSHNALPIGSIRKQNGHIVVKCVDGKWRYRARLIWETICGAIPTGHLIHHKNGNAFDDASDNLQLMTRAEHAQLHGSSETMRSRGILGRMSQKKAPTKV